MKYARVVNGVIDSIVMPGAAYLVERYQETIEAPEPAEGEEPGEAIIIELERRVLKPGLIEVPDNYFGGWIEQEDGSFVAPVAPASERRDFKLAALPARRWEAQQKFSYDGVSPVARGADTSGNLLGRIDQLRNLPEGATKPWKLGQDALRMWTLPQYEALRDAGAQFDDLCFQHEFVLRAMLNNPQIDPDDVDIDSGWPD
ncbi:MAG: hypothetical protein ABW199_09290 [Caulobacterales bacterium]